MNIFVKNQGYFCLLRSRWPNTLLLQNSLFMRYLIKNFLVCAVLFFPVFSCYSQITNSGINGRVTKTDSTLMQGVKIVATHVPTGSLFGATTDEHGSYRLPGMEVGGPYTVKASQKGFETFVQEKIYLNLGQTYRLNILMKPSKVKHKKQNTKDK